MGSSTSSREASLVEGLTSCWPQGLLCPSSHSWALTFVSSPLYLKCWTKHSYVLSSPSKNLNMFCLIKKMSNTPYRSNREEKKRRRMPLEIQTHCRKAELSTAPYRAHVSRVLLLIKCRNTSTIQMQWIKLEQACKSQIPLAKKLPLCMWTSHEVFPF